MSLSRYTLPVILNRNRNWSLNKLPNKLDSNMPKRFCKKLNRRRSIRMKRKTFLLRRMLSKVMLRICNRNLKGLKKESLLKKSVNLLRITFLLYRIRAFIRKLKGIENASLVVHLTLLVRICIQGPRIKRFQFLGKIRISKERSLQESIHIKRQGILDRFFQQTCLMMDSFWLRQVRIRWSKFGSSRLRSCITTFQDIENQSHQYFSFLIALNYAQDRWTDK